MQNVLLGFPFIKSIEELANDLESLFDEIQFNDFMPDQFVLRKQVNKKDEYVALIEHPDIKERWEEWFEDGDYELVMSLESFIEFRFRTLETANACLKHLASLFPNMIIEFDEYHLTSAEFLFRIEKEPEWDWRDYDWNPWLNYNWGLPS